ncbi:hypothetical protein BC827DRAFT_1249829 [Russula dissimulans]|nr:hypothetical protein BC827DRAFT_1249829 [Russula dissimulans]
MTDGRTSQLTNIPYLDNSTQVIKVFTEDIGGNINMIEGVARGIESNLKAARTETDEW